jgi:hypothetical protein
VVGAALWRRVDSGQGSPELGLYIARGKGISERRSPGNEFDRGEAKSAAARAFPWAANEVA